MIVSALKFQSLLNKCQIHCIPFSNSKSVKMFRSEMKKKQSTNVISAFLCNLIIVACLAIAATLRFDDECFLSTTSAIKNVFRPVEKCNFCEGVQSVEKISEISTKEFEAKFAYTGRPVIIIDATKNWTASGIFDFAYFKKLYANVKRRRNVRNCQFFPYKNSFLDLYEALGITHSRTDLQEGHEQWYFGWGNCDSEVAEKLRQHYDRPYFLPATSENNAVDWIFMGGINQGAHMHVDNVRLPSWQAQIKGSKKWILSPPPECYFQCNAMQTTVNRGEIIILDTNKWYHQTVNPVTDVTITIGAEYD